MHLIAHSYVVNLVVIFFKPPEHIRIAKGKYGIQSVVGYYLDLLTVRPEFCKDGNKDQYEESFSSICYSPQDMQHDV